MTTVSAIRKKRNACAQLTTASQIIDNARQMTRITASFAQPFLEGVKLLDHGYGKVDVVVLKRKNCTGIRQKNIGIEHKLLFQIQTPRVSSFGTMNLL